MERPPSSRLRSWPELAYDLKLIAFAGSASLCVGRVGLILNQVRSTRLPLAYRLKEQRSMEVVGKVSAVAPATIEMTAGTIQHVTLGEFMELAKQEGSLILDARPQVFYRSGNIPGAI